MDEQRDEIPEIQQPEQKPYVERPAWQVWLARLGLAAFLLFLVIYYFTMFSGGGR